MNAREIALSKIKEKKDKEAEAVRIAAEVKIYLTKQGKEFYKIVDEILIPFEEDFTIVRKSDSKGQSSYGWYVWEFAKPKNNPLFYVMLRYETHTGKFSDDTPEQEWSEWYVTVQVRKDVYYRKYNPYYKYEGRYSSILDTTVLEDFSCSSSRIKDELETKFGEYMARWYSEDRS